MADEPPETPHPDDALAVALAAGKTFRDAATAAGMAERTAFRRQADPAFRQRVAELRAALVDLAIGRLADGMAEGADVLRQLLAAEVAPTVRLGAARSLLELGTRLRESVEQEQRLRRLEQAMARFGGGK